MRARASVWVCTRVWFASKLCFFCPTMEKKGGGGFPFRPPQQHTQVDSSPVSCRNVHLLKLCVDLLVVLIVFEQLGNLTWLLANQTSSKKGKPQASPRERVVRVQCETPKTGSSAFNSSTQSEKKPQQTNQQTNSPMSHKSA